MYREASEVLGHMVDVFNHRLARTLQDHPIFFGCLRVLRFIGGFDVYEDIAKTLDEVVRRMKDVQEKTPNPALLESTLQLKVGISQLRLTRKYDEKLLRRVVQTLKTLQRGDYLDALS